MRDKPNAGRKKARNVSCKVFKVARPRMHLANQLTNKNKQRQQKIHMYLMGEQAEMHLNTFVRSSRDKC